MMERDLILKHLSLIGRPVEPSELGFYTPDAVLRLMYAPEGHTKVKEGAVEIAAFMARISQFFRDFVVGEPRVIKTETGFVAEYHGDSVCIETGLPYSQDYVAIVTVEDGKIKEIREYYDPIRVLRAIGDLP